MATIKEAGPWPWRLRLVEASYAGVRFHVEQQSRNSGRRVVLHEYPKRDKPYSEDMGRHAIRYQITGYVIGTDYHLRKEALIDVLENKEGGLLVDPYLAKGLMVICERYSVTEVRERGGYASFDMAFSELGVAGNSQPTTNTASTLRNGADTASQQTAQTLNQNTPDSTPTTSPRGGYVPPTAPHGTGIEPI